MKVLGVMHMWSACIIAAYTLACLIAAYSFGYDRAVGELKPAMKAANLQLLEDNHTLKECRTQMAEDQDTFSMMSDHIKQCEDVK